MDFFDIIGSLLDFIVAFPDFFMCVAAVVLVLLLMSCVLLFVHKGVKRS